MTFSLPRPQLSWLLSTLFLAVVICASIVVTLSRTSQVGGWQALVVRSGSMEPAISTGSVVLVQKQSEYGPNDVITFRDGGQLVTHRVVEKKVVNWQSQYATKGDANDAPDKEVVTYSDIAGKVSFSVPFLGYFFSFLQTPLGVTLFVVIPGTILLYEHVKRIRQAWSSHRAVVALVALAFWSVLPIHTTLAVYATTTQVQEMIFATTRWILPEATFARDVAELKIAIAQAGGVDRIEFEVHYDHQVEGETVEEHVTGDVGKEISQEDLDLPAITIGTCSAEVCIPHEEVENMEIKLRFMNGEENVHEITAPFDF
jgi:signal peptidase